MPLNTLGELPEGAHGDYLQVFTVVIRGKPSGKSVLSARVKCSYRVQSRSFVALTKLAMLIVLRMQTFDDGSSLSIYNSPCQS